ncbi:MAG: cation diffusion facilitator family transporter, partial [Armatimonadota bacterium]
MTGIFAASFMRTALLAGLIIGGVCAYMGVHVVLRRIVFVGAALAQVSSCGVGLALLTGLNPSLMALLLTLGFAAVETMAGFWSGSLALLGDAGHMVTDSASLGLAAFAAVLARRPPSPRHTYGLGRVETLAALLN